MDPVKAGIDWSRAQTVANGLWLDFEARVTPWNTHGMLVPFEKTLDFDGGMPETDDDKILARACQLLARVHPEIVIRPVRKGVIIAWRGPYDGVDARDRALLRKSGGEVLPMPDAVALFGVPAEAEKKNG